MSDRMRGLVDEILRLQGELDDEIEARRTTLGISLRGHLAEFEDEVAAQNRKLRQGLRRFFAEAPPLHILTSPLIYSMIVPLALLDLWSTVYQAICFRVYGIARVRRADHVVIDRHRLGYLNGIEKLNCVFCGYGNGVIGYVREIASRTEQYWCPIKHALRVPDPHPRYIGFVDYGDAQAYRTQLKQLRDTLAKESEAAQQSSV